MKADATLQFVSAKSVLTAIPALLAVLFASSVFAATVKGTVTNKTTNRPDANDDVVLIALTQNMQEVARTKTDRTGHYSIDVPDSGMHLIRVDHQKAAYFNAVPPDTTNVDVTVYDVSPKVDGLTVEADMVRIETDGQGLHVIESYFVTNNSTPPRTQFGPKSFEIYLPADAKLDASIAMGPNGMPVASVPAPAGEPGHYAFVFPVRPGETRFQVEYHLPDSDTHHFQPHLSLPTANYALVLPKSMKFNAEGSISFESMNGDVNTQSLLAKNLSVMKPISYTVSGRGTLPKDTSPRDTGSSSGSTAQPESTGTENRPGGGMAAPINTPTPLDKYKWWTISGIAFILAVTAGIFLRSGGSLNRENASSPVESALLPQQDPHNILLAALKNELFSLETERLQGKLSTEEYQQQKSALEIVLRRALRDATPPNAATEKQNSADTQAT